MPVPTCEVEAEGCDEGVAYEAVVAVMNDDGWGTPSTPSSPASIGELKPRAKPPMPAPPRLTALGEGRLKVCWSLPESCPRVEASQLRVTDMGCNKNWLVDASNGKLVQSGRTTFAAPRCEITLQDVQDGVEYVAAVCCRNAEGFGDYSIDSDPVVNLDPRTRDSTVGLALVLAEDPNQSQVPGAPTLEPLAKGEGKMKVKWPLPEEAKSTTVKMRRVGDQNWYLCGGTAIEAPECETIAKGLEEGIEYEAMVSYLIHGRWCNDSPVCKPACIGEKKLPGIPGESIAPLLWVVDQHDCRMRVKWQPLTAVPAVTSVVVKFRPLGARCWQYVHPSTSQLSVEETDPVPTPRNEIDVLGLKSGVPYEAAVAYRNRLGTGLDSPLSDIACIGRPAPKLLKCTCCFADFDLQHADYTKDTDLFWCPVCRFRNMDPFNAIIEPSGILMYHICTRPTITFNLDIPELKTWRKDEHAVFMRMVRIDSDNCAQVWPRRLLLETNGHPAIDIKEPEEGHVRRDVPKDISASLKPGLNHITIKIEDEYVAGYVMALVRTNFRTAKDISTDITVHEEEDARERVCSLLAGNWSNMGEEGDEEDDIKCVLSNKLKLRCPLSFERVVIPVRGESCMHLQCFGLGAYLESNAKMRALNNRWTCPVCANILRPRDLRIDAYVDKVLQETPPHVEDVLIMQDGSYKIVEEQLIPKPAPTPPPQEDAGSAEMMSETVDVEGAARAAQKRKAAMAKMMANQAARPVAKRRRRQKILEVNNESDEDLDGDAVVDAVVDAVLDRKSSDADAPELAGVVAAA